MICWCCRIARPQRSVMRCTKKKPGCKEPGLRYWPREADTITFQEGLLNLRATGGGGQMRSATAQRLNIMIRVSALQQPSTPHVSHAEVGGRCRQTSTTVALNRCCAPDMK